MNAYRLSYRYLPIILIAINLVYLITWLYHYNYSITNNAFATINLVPMAKLLTMIATHNVVATRNKCVEVLGEIQCTRCQVIYTLTFFLPSYISLFLFNFWFKRKNKNIWKGHDVMDGWWVTSLLSLLFRKKYRFSLQFPVLGLCKCCSKWSGPTASVCRQLHLHRISTSPFIFYKIYNVSLFFFLIWIIFHSRST